MIDENIEQVAAALAAEGRAPHTFAGATGEHRTPKEIVGGIDVETALTAADRTNNLLSVGTMTTIEKAVIVLARAYRNAQLDHMRDIVADVGRLAHEPCEQHKALRYFAAEAIRYVGFAEIGDWNRVDGNKLADALSQVLCKLQAAYSAQLTRNTRATPPAEWRGDMLDYLKQRMGVSPPPRTEDAGSRPDELVTQRSAPSEIAKRAAHWREYPGSTPTDGHDQRALCWIGTGDGMAYIGLRAYCFNAGDPYWSSNGRRNEGETVTHWMPLPEPPCLTATKGGE